MSVKRVAVAALVAILSWGSVTSGEEGEGSMLLDTVRAGRLAEVRSMLGKADLEARDDSGARRCCSPPMPTTSRSRAH